jgi:prolipoprotein diacylglyceryltransferase
MPMEKVFNSAFLVAAISLFFARLFYVIFYPKDIFLSILGFILFPYFPGLSLTGTVIGGILFLFIYSKFQKLPLAKMYDFFSVALLTTLPFGYFGFLILEGKSYFPTFIFSFLCYLVLLLLFVKVFIPMSFRSKIKPGSLCLMFLVCFSIISFFSKNILNFKLFSLENLILLVLFLVSLSGFLIREVFVTRGVRK